MHNPSIRTRIGWLVFLLILGLGLALVADRAAVRAADDPATSCAGQRFNDVCPGDWHYPFVMDLVNRGAISGYSDGSFRPGNTITRGQIVKVIIVATGLSATIPGSPTFADVPTSNGFFQWVEIATAQGVISGYGCGGPGEPCDGQNRPYFRPNAAVNRGQIAKMIVQAQDWNPPNPTSQRFSDVAPGSPYYIYVDYVAARGVISGYADGTFRPGQATTRSQASKIISLAVSGAPTPGPSATPQPVPTGSGYWNPPASIPCPLFPADNIWNRNIRSLPVHARSNNFINNIGGGSVLHPDFGSGTWQGDRIGIPYMVVPGNQSRVPVSFQWPLESDPGLYPIPSNATIEGGSDRHVLVVESGSCDVYEMYAAARNGNGSWDAGAGARWGLSGNTLRPNGWTSADAAGLPILPGLVRYDEVAAGAINHAIRFTTENINRSYVWPARHSDGSATDANVLPMGSRLRLKAGVNISSYPAQVQVILRALQDYGMILADTGDALNISGTPDPRWNDPTLLAMEGIRASDFEVVDVSSLMIDPNSGQSR